MPILLAFPRDLVKSFVKAHSRKLKDGRRVDIPAHYDKRTRKGAEHAPHHGHNLTHLSPEDQSRFDAMHREQHLLTFYHGHALKNRLAHHQQAIQTLNERAEAFAKQGAHKAATKLRNKAIKLNSAAIRHSRALETVQTATGWLASEKEKRVQGAGTLDTGNAEKHHEMYVGKLGSPWKPLFVLSPDGKADFGKVPKLDSVLTEGKEYPEAPIRMEEGGGYGKAHIQPERLKEFQEHGYPSAADFLSDVAQHYSHIYEQPNGRLLLVKRNGRAKFASVELQKEADGYYGVTTLILEEEKPRTKKPYEQRSGRKLLWPVALVNPSGKDTPFPDSSDKTGEPSAGARESNFHKDSIATNGGGEVAKDGALPDPNNPGGHFVMRPVRNAYGSWNQYGLRLNGKVYSDEDASTIIGNPKDWKPVKQDYADILRQYYETKPKSKWTASYHRLKDFQGRTKGMPEMLSERKRIFDLSPEDAQKEYDNQTRQSISQSGQQPLRLDALKDGTKVSSHHGGGRTDYIARFSKDEKAWYAVEGEDITLPDGEWEGKPIRENDAKNWSMEASSPDAAAFPAFNYNLFNSLLNSSVKKVAKLRGVAEKYVRMDRELIGDAMHIAFAGHGNSFMDTLNSHKITNPVLEWMSSAKGAEINVLYKKFMQSTEGKGMSDGEKREWLLNKVNAGKANAASKQEPGPQEGDVDASGLVFHNGRWHRDSAATPPLVKVRHNGRENAITIMGYRKLNSPSVGSNGTFYNVNKPGIKGIDYNKVVLNFENPLVITDPDVEIYEGLPLEYLFHKWFPDFDYVAKANKRGVESGLVIDEMVTAEAVRRGYDGLILGNLEIVDLKNIVPARLAPNGKPSNLNALQHAQVRTPQFKAWFGDWEKAAKIEELKSGEATVVQGNEFADFKEPLDMEALRHKARAYGEANIVGEYRNISDTRTLEIRPKGVKETVQHGSGPDKLKALVALPDVVRNGVIVYDGPNPKNTRARLVVISKRVLISGKPHVVTAGFKEDSSGSGKLFYDHELWDVNRVEGLSSQSGEGLAPHHPGPTSTRLNEYYRRFLAQEVQSSKVVDGNGEPLVVYHGTASAGITRFLPDGGNMESGAKTLELYRGAKENNGKFGYMTFRHGSFFSPDPEYAGNYTGEEGGVMYPVYIQAYNPVYMDQVTGEVSGHNPNDTPDALIMKDNKTINEVAVIESYQTKSAIGNSGAFSLTDEDFTKSERPILLAFPKGLLAKSEVKGHLRTLANGKVSFVREHGDKRERRGAGDFEYNPDMTVKTQPVRILVDVVQDEKRGRGYYYHQISEIDLGDPVGKSRSQSGEPQTNYPESPEPELTLGQVAGKVKGDGDRTKADIANLAGKDDTARFSANPANSIAKAVQTGGKPLQKPARPFLVSFPKRASNR